MLRLPCIFIYLVCIAALPLQAQTDTLKERMLAGDVRDLLGDPDTTQRKGLTTEILDMVAQHVQEAPGIVYVLTAEEIAASGSRDLDEALMLIPSLVLGRDEDNLTGVSIRGIWAIEGKCLFMLNGMPLNESSFGTFSLGMRMPLDNVARIEVINGPGSVQGSFAALGVVNIITKDSRDGEGMNVSFTNTQIGPDATRRWAGIHGSHRLSEVSEITYAANVSAGPRFTGTLQEDQGWTNFSDSTQAQTVNGYFSVRRKGFRGQFWGSDHAFMVDDESYSIRMRTLMAQGEQNLVLSRNTRVAFGGSYRHQLPWWHENDSAWTHHVLNTIDERAMLSGMLLTQPLTGVQVRVGVQGSMDKSRFSTRTPGPLFAYNGRPDITAWEEAFHAEVVLRGRAGTFIGGARAVSNSMSGQFIAPRFAYTKLLGRWHTKLLATNACKLPTTQNMSRHWGDGHLSTETVWTYEAEVGYHVGDGTSISLCAFDTRMNDIITSVHDEDSMGYENGGGAATRGLELNFRYRSRTAGFYLSASTYEVQQAFTSFDEVELPEPYAKAFHGVPQHKIAGLVYWRPWTTGRIDLRGVWMSKTHSYLKCSDEEEEVQPGADVREGFDFTEFPDVFRLNAGVSFSFKRLEGFRIRLGCENILDRTLWTLSPHDDGDRALPNAGRQFTVKLEYRFPL